jgi:hypothetical protein
MNGLTNAIRVLEEARSVGISKKVLGLMSKTGVVGGGGPQEGELYNIGAGGLTPVKSGILKIQANQVYSMGASHTPEWIYITKAPDKDGVFYYRNYPFARNKDRKGTLKYLEDLIIDGTKQELLNLQSYKFKSSWVRDRISRIKTLLANKKAHPKNLRDYDEFDVVAFSADGTDQWRTAERYGSVAGLKNDEGEWDNLRYSIEGVKRSTLQMLKRDKRLKIISIKKAI